MKTAYYLITIVPSSGKSVSAVRVLDEEPIDKLWNQYEMKANGVYRDLKYFNIVQLSRYSQEVQSFLNKKSNQASTQVIPIGKKRNEPGKPDNWKLGDRKNDQ
ncbi:MAG: hypothetical protein EOO01_22610 [Chitinophagaceae bacterium]|nr:MAG: hypothetical protein EOO01_22610 [Chitinophagaceae bacterium]